MIGLAIVGFLAFLLGWLCCALCCAAQQGDRHLERMEKGPTIRGQRLLRFRTQNQIQAWLAQRQGKQGGGDGQ